MHQDRPSTSNKISTGIGGRYQLHGLARICGIIVATWQGWSINHQRKRVGPSSEHKAANLSSGGRQQHTRAGTASSWKFQPIPRTTGHGGHFTFNL